LWFPELGGNASKKIRKLGRRKLVNSEHHKVSEAHQPILKEYEQRTCRAIGNLENQQTEILRTGS